jgi:uncharacterized membrane protein YgdD (TMEM256/DUF423 family)
MKSHFLCLGALTALIAVTMGALGAHGLKSQLSLEMMTIYQTAVNYQMWHALGLISIAVLRLQHPDAKLLAVAGWLMFAGICLFSGSLYALAIFQVSGLGIVTPIGGVCFLLAWLIASIFAMQKQQSKRYS